MRSPVDAPEQATDRVVDEKTDIYNFGATMYRMLTGQYANLGGMAGVGNGLLGVRSRPTPPIQIDPSIPGTLNEAILACLEPNPDHRPAGFFEIKPQLVAVARYMGLKSDDLKGADEEDCD